MLADPLNVKAPRTRPALLASFLFGLVVFLLLSACSRAPQLEILRLSGATMGTSYHVSIVTAEEIADPGQIQSGIDQLLQAINLAMSTYIEGSEINRLNESVIGQWVPLSADLLAVMQISTEVSDLSAGAFDVTVRPLIDLWGFGPKPGTNTVPAAAEIRQALDSIGYQKMLLDVAGARLQRLQPVSLDLSAVAKGYGVDRLAGYLQELGYQNYLVEIGGELRLHGHNAHGEQWRIAIERPDSLLATSVYRALQLTNTGIATSGDYRNYFEENGVRYSHTVDPRSGYPINHNLASVTVLDPSAARADALATAFNVLGLEQALPLANSQGIAAMFIIKQGDTFAEVASEAFQAYLESGQ
ncbi:FAD:protein FMN transferase [Pseudomaricurvus alcaniphilus]|uniref:FAD:protein FMN transferase n=1 Tax=Pseudomaricurvus alcaniphilus TaxID=1166482 RepID=UPI003132ED37